MSDEIKENNTPNHILSALGDLTNGAINYYQLPKVTLEEQKMILDYITNLQEENDRLNNIINELEKWVDEYPSEDVWYEHITNKLKELKENK